MISPPNRSSGGFCHRGIIRPGIVDRLSVPDGTGRTGVAGQLMSVTDNLPAGLDPRILGAVDDISAMPVVVGAVGQVVADRLKVELIDTCFFRIIKD